MTMQISFTSTGHKPVGNGQCQFAATAEAKSSHRP